MTTHTPFVNLADFMPTETVPFEIPRPGSSAGSGWILQLVGPGHPQAVAYSNAQTQRDLSRAAQQEQTRLNGKKVIVEDRNPQQVREENVGWMTSRIVGWNPVLIPFIDESKPTEYSPEIALKVFSNPLMGWALTPLLEKLGDDASFTKRSAIA